MGRSLLTAWDTLSYARRTSALTGRSCCKMERHFDVAIYSVPSSSFIFLKYLIGAKPEIEAMTFRSADQRANKTFVTGRLASGSGNGRILLRH